MSITKVFETLAKIRSTPGRNAKIDLLETISKDKDGYSFFKHAVDKATNLWVTAPEIDALFFKGKKLSGEFEHRWTKFQALFKLLSSRKITGSAAQKALLEFITSCNNEAPFFEGTWYCGAVDRHLNIGVSDSAIKKIWPDLVSDFAVQLANSLYIQKTGKIDPKVRDCIKFPCVDEPKLDGINVSIVVNNGQAAAYSRANKLLPALQPFADAFAQALKKANAKGFKHKNFVWNGEFKADRHKSDPKNWKSSWGKSIALCHAGINASGFDDKNIDAYSRICLQRDLYFTVYNCYPFETYISGTWDMPYGSTNTPRTRSSLFKAFVAAAIAANKKLRIYVIEQYVCNNLAELKVAHKKCIASGAEGSMIKSMTAGVTLDRTSDFIKWKQYSKIDAYILGVNRGTGKNKDKAGTFECYIPSIDDTIKVTARTDAVKEWAWANRELLAGYLLEAVEDGAEDDVAKSRNPILGRFRNDVAPMPVNEVLALCHRFNLPKPKSRIPAQQFNKVTASFKGF